MDGEDEGGKYIYQKHVYLIPSVFLFDNDILVSESYGETYIPLEIPSLGGPYQRVD